MIKIQINEIIEKLNSLPNRGPLIIEQYHIFYTDELKFGPGETCLICYQKDINRGGIRIQNIKKNNEYYLHYIEKHHLETHITEITDLSLAFKGTDNCGNTNLKNLCSVLEIMEQTQKKRFFEVSRFKS